MEQADSTYAPMSDLTIFEAVDFQNKLVALLAQDGPVTVDVSHAQHIDCACLQILLAARRSGRLAIKGLSDSVRLKAGQLGCRELVGN